MDIISFYDLQYTELGILRESAFSHTINLTNALSYFINTLIDLLSVAIEKEMVLVERFTSKVPMIAFVKNITMEQVATRVLSLGTNELV